jgi:hypothetical protein
LHLFILLLIQFLLSHLTLIGQTISCLLVVLQPGLVSSTFTWCVQPLHIQRQITICHNLVTEFTKLQIHSKIRTGIHVEIDMTLKITICISNPLAMLELPPALFANPISI